MPTIKLSNLRKILNINCSEKNNFGKKCDLAILSDVETDDFTENNVGFFVNKKENANKRMIFFNARYYDMSANSVRMNVFIDKEDVIKSIEIYYNLKCTEINLEFDIRSDFFDVDMVTKELQVQPTKTWKKGDKSKLYSHRYDFTLWEYEVGFEDCMDVEEITEKFLNVFGSKIKKLKELKKKFNLDYNVYYTVKVHNKRLPSVAFSEEMMKFLHEIEARCGFDMYDFS